MKLKQLIKDIDEELSYPSLGRQRKRYLQEYLEELVAYQNNHPEAIEAPNSLELYCDKNPESLECRIYDD